MVGIKSKEALHGIIDKYHPEIMIKDEITQKQTGYYIVSETNIPELDEFADLYMHLLPNELDQERCYVYKENRLHGDVIYRIICPWKWIY